ncbi:MAG TPA: DUF1294 domain-containing protein [Devosia sp.]|nr:DUF1294 domain-containing protein [Devosia sp.]
MRLTGELVQWNNKGGYGFVRDAGARDYYVHISKMGTEQRPKLGDRLSFTIATGRNGRPAAVEVEIIPAQPASAPTLRQVVLDRPHNLWRLSIGLRVAAATMMALLLLAAISAERAPSWLAVVYATMGLASALLYHFDKSYALTGKWRVSERNLHLVDACFGIIGGLVAQELYRHKTVKPGFVSTTWGLALVHVLGLAAMAFGWFGVALPLI